MSEQLESQEGCSWEDSVFDALSRRITDVVNTAIVDEEGKWRCHLINEIMSIVKQSGNASNTKRRCPKPKFVVGPSDSADEGSSDGETAETSGVELPVPSSSAGFLSVEVRPKSFSCLPGKSDDAVTTADLVDRFKTTDDLSSLADDEIVQLLNLGHVKHRELEAKLGSDHGRAVRLRRLHMSSSSNLPLNELPFEDYDYTVVTGACCENVIGYVPIPTGFAGPLLINGKLYTIPLATTEGALVASTNRGCKAVTDAKGVWSRVFKDGMTRAPVLQFRTAMDALELKGWLEDPIHFEKVKHTFDATSNYARLTSVDADLSGRLLFVRFEATTGDAMGMNMVSKGVNAVLHMLVKMFPEMEILSLSGNYCVDKKASAINWIKGRGKSVVSEAIIPSTIVRGVLKTDVKSMCALARAKLLIGSSMAGTIGGWNAHAANIVTAMFLATGQDVAQVVSSSMCMTTMEETAHGDLRISCTMRCLEVGTVGGGTILPAQKACLKMLGCDGAGKDGRKSGENAKQLAEVICATVLAGELSLMAAQCTDDLVKSHLKLNRSAQTLCYSQPCSRPPTVPAIREYAGNTMEPGLPLYATTRIALSVRNRASEKGDDDSKLECSAIL